MVATTNKVAVLHQCRVAPPPGAATEKSLPLTFYDITFIITRLIKHQFFFNFPHPKAHFIDTVIPQLKESLSLTLEHFSPLAGHLYSPVKSSNDDRKPVIRYLDGDSVPLIFAESDEDFNYLTDDHIPRQADKYYHLIPEVAPPIVEEDTVKTPLLAVQVTLFPGSGICIGLAVHHVCIDVSPLISFMQSWASVTNLGFYNPKLLTPPSYDRSVIKDPHGLEDIYWKETRELDPEPDYYPPADKFRKSFILRRADVQKLRTSVLEQNPNLHASAFAMAAAYVWICMLKSRARVLELEDGEEFFVFPVSCRMRMDPQIPENYFGNCVVMCYTHELRKPMTSQLTGEGGLVVAVELIGDCIKERVKSNEALLHGLENRMHGFEGLEFRRGHAVGGSAKARFYDVDFGWGEPRRSEVINTDCLENLFTFNACKDSKDDLEIGVSLPMSRLDSFSNIFAEGLEKL